MSRKTTAARRLIWNAMRWNTESDGVVRPRRSLNEALAAIGIPKKGKKMAVRMEKAAMGK